MSVLGVRRYLPDGVEKFCCQLQGSDELVLSELTAGNWFGGFRVLRPETLLRKESRA